MNSIAPGWDLVRARDAQLLPDQFRHAATGETAADRGDRHQAADVGVLGANPIEHPPARLKEHLDNIESRARHIHPVDTARFPSWLTLLPS
ncbi:hypothetical protein ACTXG6_19260 [Pseudonocardia sp. Cha107L01]|uniref:hypothetical protein n=1 Tax=Pseudonocardia sp. Cha107L01 TaxID=3457576 RepID=UPI00403E63AE